MIAKRKSILKESLIVSLPSGFIMGAAPGFIFNIDATFWQLFTYVMVMSACLIYRDIAREIMETKEEEEKKK